jgi:hypothetical protein
MAPTRTEETGRAGPGSSAGLGCAAGKGEDGLGLSGCGLVFFLFLFHLQILFPNLFKHQTNFEFKSRFESNNQKPCTSMYATVNSYISLIN